MRLQLEDLESRVLLAGTPSMLVIQVQPTQVAVGSAMFPAMQVAVCDVTQQTVTTDTSTVVMNIFSGPSGGQFVVGGSTSSFTLSVAAVKGVATFSNLSFSIPGIYEVAVNDGSLAGTASNFFNVTAAASKLAFVQQPTASIAVGTQFTPAIAAWVEDASGNLITSDRSAVTLSIVSGPSGGALTGTTTVNAVTGVAIFNGIGFSKAGSYVLKVTDGTLTLAQTGTITVTGSTTANLSFAGTLPGVTAGATLPPVMVNVTDNSGNILTTDNSTVALSIVSGPSGGTLTGTTSISAVNGVATFSNLSLAKAGTYTLKATAGSASANSNAFTVTVGDAAELVFAKSPINAPANSTVPSFSVNITDAAGVNIVTTVNTAVTLSLTAGPAGGTVSGTTTVTATNGVASFSGLTFSAMGTYTLTASSGTLSAGTGTFVITGTASQLAFVVQPSTVSVNAAISPAVVVYLEDSNGDLVTNAAETITIAVESGPGTLGGTMTVTATNGSASFSNLMLSAVGTYTLSASAPGLTGATSHSFVVTAAASQLAFLQQPTNVASGSTMSPAVTVQILDSLGHVATTNTSSVTLVILAGPENGTIGGTTTVAAVNGVATFSTLKFGVKGTYTLVAYDGALATATAHSFVVGQGAKKLAFGTAPADITAGRTMRITAMVEDVNGNVVPDDSVVTLAIVSGTGPTGAKITGNATANAFNGRVTFEVALDKQGTYQLTVTDGNLTAAKSERFSVFPDVSQAHVAVTRSPAATVVGRQFVSNPVISIIDNFSNVIDSGASVVITLSDGLGGTLSGTTVVTANHGVAQFTDLSINVAGTRTLTVAGPGLVNPGTASFQMTISPVVTSMNKPSTAASYAAGQDFTLTTTLRGVVSSPLAWTGMARLIDANNVELPANSVLQSDGTLKLTVGGMTAGTYTVRVAYDGDANHLGTVSSPFVLTVGKGTTLTVKPAATQIPAGGTLTLNVTVGASKTSTARTGILQLIENGVVVATQTLGADSKATIDLPNPPMGAHVYTVVYGGDINFMGSTSSKVNVTVGTATTTSLSPSGKTIDVGDLLNLDVTVKTAASGAAARTGSVQLFDNGTAIGTQTLDGSSHVTFPVNPTLGKHSFTVVYAGDGFYRGSTSAAVKVTVGKEATLTVVTPSATQSTFGTALTINVTVGGANGTTVARTGTVLLKDGKIVLGAAVLDADSKVVFTVTPKGGTHAFKAVYQGDGNFTASTSAAANIAVAKDSTVVTTTSASQIHLGDLFDLSVQVLAGGTTTAARTGAIVLQEDGSTLMTLNLDSGSAADFVFTPTAGTHHYKVTYKGDGNYAASAPTQVDLTVGSAATVTLIAPSATQVSFGTVFTIGAQVTSFANTNSTANILDGTIWLKDGNVTVATHSLDSHASTIFTLDQTMATVGTHTFTVVYAGNANFTTSTSTAATLKVTKASTTATLTPSALTVDAGGALTLDVDVTAIGGATTARTGNVTLRDGSNAIGTLTLDGGSHASFVVHPAVGDHTYSVSYAGDSNFAVSTSSTATVAAGIATNVDVSPSGTQFHVGAPVTLTVSVVNAVTLAAAGTGNVQLLDNGTVVDTKALNGSSQAVFTFTPALGNHSYTVSYAGDATYRTSTSSAIAIGVAQESTTTTVTPSATNITAGTTLTLSVSVVADNGATTARTGLVALKDGDTVVATLTLSGTSQATFTLTPTSGTHTYTVVYLGDADFLGSVTATAATVTVS